MSWVQHKKPPIVTTTSSSSSPKTTSFSTHSSLLLNTSSNYHNSSLLNTSTTNRNINSLRQPVTSSPLNQKAAQQNCPNNLLMTSQYSNKAYPTLKSNSSTATMRLNPATTPYQAQQHHAATPTQQQRHQQHHYQNTLHQPPAIAQQTTNASSSSAPHLTQQQQQNSLSNQQTAYLPATKMMQPTPPPAVNPAVTIAAATNYVNMYQQNTATQQPPPPQQQQQQQWAQNPQQISPPRAAFDNNYYQQQQLTSPANNNMYQSAPSANIQQQQVAQTNPETFFQQQQPPSQQAVQNQTNPANFFDNANYINNNQTSDSWGDWDWNDNSLSESAQFKTEVIQQANQQQGNFNSSSILAESFNNQNNNDNWNWEANENDQQVPNNLNKENQSIDNANNTQNDGWNWQTNANDNENLLQQEQQQQPIVTSQPSGNEQHNDNWNWHSTNENQQQQQHMAKAAGAGQASSPPPPPPPTEFSSTAATENHNYNTNATANNIPNTVFVTQAKPVTLPSRQYASPPSGNTPVTENPSETALMPPQAFQNIEDYAIIPQAVASPPLPPAYVTTPPLHNIPPPAGMPTEGGNPFKRSGVAQHHRASGLMNTPNPAVAALNPTVFSMPPPPPADFANPGSVSLLEPDNNELLSQENQEVLIPLSSNITLPNVAIQPAASGQISATISLPNAPMSTQLPVPPPPNDERNQYLQTSHLSENSDEQQPAEADGLLPPPGLSRLVLGEPELEVSQQRLVMGTETPQDDSAVTQAAVMHLEERHADGEDTASETAVPVISLAGQGAATTASTLTSDRNLYLVPGESNNTVTQQQQQQRVVTGVELGEQREIEMDGENLEDEQIQQQQQQQFQLQQQHHLHQQQNLHTLTNLSPEARNEPPVEGADDNIGAASVTLPSVSSNHTIEEHHIDHQQHSNNQLNKIKDNNPISSPNDDDDSDERLLNERVVTQSTTGGSSKSRSKYESERLAVASRRRDKRSSTERYETDEYLNSEGEYSSEREERERRERDRRRNYREGSVRSDRGGLNDDEEKRAGRRQRGSNKRDKYYYEGEEQQQRSRGGGGGGRDERERERSDRKPDRRSQRQRGYDNDSRYETEESIRFDNRKDQSRRSLRRGDRSDQGNDYDDYNRRGVYHSSKRAPDNYESDRRDRRRSDKHRDQRYREDPRYDPREFEDYRKHSSRNARGSDMEKEGATSRSGRLHHDPRHAAMYGYYDPMSGGYYDPNTAYCYQQMARTNPQAYAEWYKKYTKYYGEVAANAAVTALGVAVPGAGHAENTLTTTGNDGRESVHSGRSSAQNDIKDRYRHAYITQANEYHRHYQQQQQQHHHQQQQQQQHLHQQHLHYNQQHQQQQQQQMAFNQSLNSTMLDDDCLNHNTSLYSDLARSSSNLSQIQGGYYSLPVTVAAASGVYYARSDYAESRSGAISVRDPDPVALEPQRLTPCKFITEHTVVNFASSILVTVKPKYTPNGSISNIVKLLKFKPNDEARKLFKVFPGPLVRGLTHKKTVIEFCHEQIRLGPMETTIYAKQLISNNAEKYRGSYTLMWNLLILLLKQNGMVVGTDIAELLLKNQQQYPYQASVFTANNSLKSGSASPVGELELTKDLAVATEPLNKFDNTEATDSLAVAQETFVEQEDTEDNSLTKSSSNSNTLSEAEITEKFRNYLLYGNVNEALEWATDNNLWGHALFLASKLDRRSHANVMMKFANKLSLNDPLQTLYQLMSGRSPSSVTCVQDEKWGDWRPHLSMILSNTSQKPELDRKAITTLGDSLFNRGDLYAAHFCYLMAQVGFGRYQELATQESSMQQHLPKLVLLGSSHYKQFQDFAHNEAIVMTEIYEYACSLNDDKFSIIEFQPYKFLLATRLLDYGFHLKSLMYLEQIAVHIARDPSKYESSFINKVYELADRLKYYDPVLEKTIDDLQPSVSDDASGVNVTPQQQEEQKWLQSLRQLAQQYKQDFSISSSTAAAEIADTHLQTSQDSNYYNQQQQQIDQQFMEINKQFSELNLQYQQQPSVTGNNEQQQQQPPMFYNSEQQTQLQEQPSVDPYQQQQQQQFSSTELPQQNNQDLQQPLAGESLMVGEHLPQDAVYQQQYTQPADVATGFSNNYYDTSQYNAIDNAAANSNLDGQQPGAAAYYWAQQQQQHVPNLAEENARPMISMPKSKTYDTDEEATAKSGNEANKKQQMSQQQQQQQQQQQKGGAKKEEKDTSKQQQQANQNSGWFGGIWNKFSLKPKNQMILPDDKNPAIVWDPEKKKWVNTDGDEDEQEALKPPPKLSDLMPQALQQQSPIQQQQQIPFMDTQQMPQQQPQYVPNTIPQPTPSPNPLQQQPQQQPQQPGPVKTPTLQSNMFKMQRNRTLKNAYVDVFNPSGAPVNKAAENILAPALPPAAVPQGGFFIPGGPAQPSATAGVDGSQEQQRYQEQSQQQHTPQFYNPNQFSSGTGY